MEAADDGWMARALALAARGRMTTSPNPAVGAVVVRDGECVGEGWHVRAGEPHAEIHALKAAGERARGATLYVTLEPCSHQGRTGPCADAVIEAGITRVVAAMQDPNPAVAGQGFKRLKAAGLRVSSGVRESEARALIAGFISRMLSGRPRLTLKFGQSLDGKIALRNGQSQWITGPLARDDVHRLRALSCAVLTGSGTVVQDDPLLTVRRRVVERQPIPIVVDSGLKTPLTAKLMDRPLVIMTTHKALQDKADIAEALIRRGVDLHGLVEDKEGQVDLTAMVFEMGRMGLNEVLVEAGPRLSGKLLKAGLVDRLVTYIAPSVLGLEAISNIQIGPFNDLKEIMEFRFIEATLVGQDLRVTLEPRGKH
jgi:diaminohydroxyphosphoribosylaminopyrimidine deaminase/5-amino-6-(5-phosphoribosylamino)uracil reductase